MAVTPLLLVGAGGFGREIAWLVHEINEEKPTYEFIGFIDDDVALTVEGYPVLGTIDAWLERIDRRVHVVCTVGDPLTRSRLVHRLAASGATFATLVHPSVRKSRWVQLGPGTIVCANTVFTTNVQVGAHGIFNLDCTVGHDTKFGDFASVMPGVHVSGDVLCGVGTYVGTGAAIINRVEIGDWTIVGAGAVVSGDLPGGVVAVGVPARPVRTNRRVPDGFVP